MSEISEQPLNIIVGSQLSSVEFVRDYVQLRFDGPCLTAITTPMVRVRNVLYKWDTPGYRDALCERIGATVCFTSVSEGEEISIGFDDGTHVLISLKPEDYQGPEAVIFDNKSEGWWVW